MEIYRAQYSLLVGLILLLISGCDWDTQCRCVETTTVFNNKRVYVDVYVIDGCNQPFTQTTVYDWGNVVTDCR